MPEIKIGKHTYGGEIRQYGHGQITVGSFCSIAGGTVGVFYKGHNTRCISTYPFSVSWNIAEIPNPITRDESIIIGNDVWIGKSVVLLGGTDIGDGACIGAYSIVAGVIPPYTVSVGNPARPIRDRFSEQETCALLNIKWWEWPDEKIMENVSLLCSDNVKRFIEEHV